MYTTSWSCWSLFWTFIFPLKSKSSDNIYIFGVESAVQAVIKYYRHWEHAQLKVIPAITSHGIARLSSPVVGKLHSQCFVTRQSSFYSTMACIEMTSLTHDKPIQVPLKWGCANCASMRTFTAESSRRWSGTLKLKMVHCPTLPSSQYGVACNLHHAWTMRERNDWTTERFNRNTYNNSELVIAKTRPISNYKRMVDLFFLIIQERKGLLMHLIFEVSLPYPCIGWISPSEQFLLRACLFLTYTLGNKTVLVVEITQTSKRWGENTIPSQQAEYQAEDSSLLSKLCQPLTKHSQQTSNSNFYMRDKQNYGFQVKFLLHQL